MDTKYNSYHEILPSDNLYERLETVNRNILLLGTELRQIKAILGFPVPDDNQGEAMAKEPKNKIASKANVNTGKKTETGDEYNFEQYREQVKSIIGITTNVIESQNEDVLRMYQNAFLVYKKTSNVDYTKLKKAYKERYGTLPASTLEMIYGSPSDRQAFLACISNLYNNK